MLNYVMDMKKVGGGGGLGLVKYWGGGGLYAQIFYGLKNITRPANYMQLPCSMLKNKISMV